MATKKLKPETVELLKRVQRWLVRLKHKKHFNMDSYGKETECGTAFCIGGKGLILTGYKFDPLRGFFSPSGYHVVHTFEASRQAFGLTGEQAMRLFHQEEWPEEFGGTDFNSASPKIAAARIQHFIQTEGRE